MPGRSPDEVERIVTVPVEIGMTGLPGLTEMRSQNEPGLSIVTLVFTDDTRRLFRAPAGDRTPAEVRTRLPQGIVPVLGPVSTALSEVYQYTLEEPDDGQRALTKRGTGGTPHRFRIGSCGRCCAPFPAWPKSIPPAAT